MLKLVQKNKGLYLAALFLIVLYSGMDIVKSMLMSQLFDNKAMLASIMSGISVVFLFLAIYLAVMVSQQYTVEVLKNKIRFNLNKQLYDVYLAMYPNEFKKYDSSVLINELNNEVSTIIDQYVASKLNIFFLLISFLLGGLYIGYLNFQILLFLYLCGFLTFIINHSFSKRFKRNQKKLLKSQQTWIKTIKNFCYNFKDIKNYGMEREFENLLDADNRNLEKGIVRSNGFMKIISAMNEGISQIMFFGTLLFGIVLINADLLTIGKLIGIVQASNMIINPIANFVNLKNGINASKPILKQFEDKVNTILQDGCEDVGESLNTIVLDNLTFGYTENPVFSNLSCQFWKGKKYLIVGKSGCGKSTLLELIAKQQSCPGIYANGTDLHTVSFHSYAQHFAYLTQKNHMLPFSLEENITLKHEINHGRLDEILKNLQLQTVFRKREQIFDNDALALSGGELQRINIARALYNKREWLFLDEAFSALDEENARRIENFIVNIPDISLISISHKLFPDIIPLYDEVITLDSNGIRMQTGEKFAKCLLAGRVSV